MAEALSELIAVWPHQGEAAELVRELKYGRATRAVTKLAEAMADASPDVDLVTWIPASPSRRRKRGFDQSELVARAIARRKGVRAARLLRRSDDKPQTARDFQGRSAGPTLKVCGPALRRNPTVLIVDDVCTTGTSLRRAAELLSARGAKRSIGLVATRTVSINETFRGGVVS